MDKLKIRVSPWFFVLAFVFVLNGDSMLFFIYFFTIVVHELAHSLIAGKLGYKLNNFELMPYGAKVSMQNGFASKKDQILIALAGPLTNLFFCFIFYFISLIFPQSFVYLKSLILANLITFLYNCLPIFPLDGGRILNAIFLQKASEKTKQNVHFVINIVFISLFVALFIISIFIKINYNFLVVAGFIFINLFEKDNSIYYDFIHTLPKESDLKQGVKIESYALNLNSTLFDCFKLLRSNQEAQFIILNEKYDVVKTFSSLQIEQMLLKIDAHKTFKEII